MNAKRLRTNDVHEPDAWGPTSSSEGVVGSYHEGDGTSNGVNYSYVVCTSALGGRYEVTRGISRQDGAIHRITVPHSQVPRRLGYHRISIGRFRHGRAKMVDTLTPHRSIDTDVPHRRIKITRTEDGQFSLFLLLRSEPSAIVHYSFVLTNHKDPKKSRMKGHTSMDH